MALYLVISVLIFLLVAYSCVALIIGLLGEVGAVRLARCPRCAHLVVNPRDTAQSCPYCRHVHLAHPLRTLRHPVRELVHH
ncbi:MAG: hypothetical protein J2P22_07760 [Nocardioides sp.]|nr:hypothetical protein [Nocardioides sp.]